MSDVAYLYEITNTMNSMVYIGVTKNPDSRMNGHACITTIPTKSLIKKAIHAHGRDKFTLRVLLKSTQEYCLEMETKVISAFNTRKPNGYNICTGGRGAIGIFGADNGMFGRQHSEETRDKIRARAMGRVASDETKEKMRVARIGITYSAESIEKMRRNALNRSPEVLQRMADGRRAAIARKLGAQQ